MSACDTKLWQALRELGWKYREFRRAHFQRDFTGLSYARLVECEVFGVGEF